jgi:hypothetical protein
MSLPTITRSNFDEHIPLSENLHIVAAIADDDTTGEPWKEHDGHGPITDWVTRAKRSGERILTQDGNSYRYYDVAEATRIAKRDGWGPMLDGMTRDQSIELAVDADFNHLSDGATTSGAGSASSSRSMRARRGSRSTACGASSATRATARTRTSSRWLTSC